MNRISPLPPPEVTKKLANERSARQRAKVWLAFATSVVVDVPSVGHAMTGADLASKFADMMTEEFYKRFPNGTGE